MTPEELIQLRHELGLTQEQLARRLGLRNRCQVRHLESGRTRISGPKLVLLEQLREELAQKEQGHAATVS